MADVKMTKRDWFETIKAIVEGSGAEQTAEAVEFIDHQIEMLDAKADKARARAAAKRTDGDELREAVYNVLTDELQTIDQIAAQIEGEEITKAKVTARLTQLVKADMAEKELVKDGSRKITAYRIAGTGAVDAE